jgi:hypothetical protein
MLGLKFADIERNEMYDHVAVVHLLDFHGDRLDMEKNIFYTSRTVWPAR